LQRGAGIPAVEALVRLRTWRIAICSARGRAKTRIPVRGLQLRGRVARRVTPRRADSDSPGPERTRASTAGIPAPRCNRARAATPIARSARSLRGDDQIETLAQRQDCACDGPVASRPIHIVHEGLVDLDRSGESSDVREGRIAGAKIIQCNPAPSRRSLSRALRTVAESLTSSDSVISISISVVGTPNAAASVSTTRAGVSVQQFLRGHVDATGTAIPRSTTCAIGRHAARTTQLPRSMIKPLSSAISMNRTARCLHDPHHTANQRFDPHDPVIAQTELRLELQAQ